MAQPRERDAGSFTPCPALARGVLLLRHAGQQGSLSPSQLSLSPTHSRRAATTCATPRSPPTCACPRACSAPSASACRMSSRSVLFPRPSLLALALCMSSAFLVAACQRGRLPRPERTRGIPRAPLFSRLRKKAATPDRGLRGTHALARARTRLVANTMAIADMLAPPPSLHPPGPTTGSACSGGWTRPTLNTSRCRGPRTAEGRACL